jgi:hypothetical protein
MGNWNVGGIPNSVTGIPSSPAKFNTFVQVVKLFTPATN